MGRRLATPVQPMQGKEHGFEPGAAGRRLKGANFVFIEARLLDGSRENSVHESFLRFPMQVVSPLFAIALTVLNRKAGRPKIEQFQASTAGRSLESNTQSRQFLRPFCGTSTARY